MLSSSSSRGYWTAIVLLLLAAWGGGLLIFTVTGWYWNDADPATMQDWLDTYKLLTIILCIVSSLSFTTVHLIAAVGVVGTPRRKRDDLRCPQCFG